jgi:hypothetical protein
MIFEASNPGIRPSPKIPEMILEASRTGINPPKKVPEVILEASKKGMRKSGKIPEMILEASRVGISEPTRADHIRPSTCIGSDLRIVPADPTPLRTVVVSVLVRRSPLVVKGSARPSAPALDLESRMFCNPLISEISTSSP